jgi:type IV secretory pathway VirB2 component (pilin)
MNKTQKHVFGDQLFDFLQGLGISLGLAFVFLGLPSLWLPGGATLLIILPFILGPLALAALLLLVFAIGVGCWFARASRARVLGVILFYPLATIAAYGSVKLSQIQYASNLQTAKATEYGEHRLDQPLHGVKTIALGSGSMGKILPRELLGYGSIEEVEVVLEHSYGTDGETMLVSKEVMLPISKCEIWGEVHNASYLSRQEFGDFDHCSFETLDRAPYSNLEVNILHFDGQANRPFGRVNAAVLIHLNGSDRKELVRWEWGTYPDGTGGDIADVTPEEFTQAVLGVAVDSRYHPSIRQGLSAAVDHVYDKRGKLHMNWGTIAFIERAFDLDAGRTPVHTDTVAKLLEIIPLLHPRCTDRCDEMLKKLKLTADRIAP